MKKIKLFANAKINLFLDIESRRSNGYHDILSLMQSVTLHDTVTVSYEESEEKKIEISVNVPSIPSNEKNIAYKAADRLIDSGYVKIEIEKNIPSPAGLAGGSADAAAVIYALESFGCVNKSSDEIMKIAAGIGADVPFCLVGGTKKITGIGDVIENVEPIVGLNLVIAIAGEGVSTPAAYGALDAKYNNFEYHDVRDFDFNNFSTDSMYNIFEDVVLKERPEAKRLLDTMYDLGARRAMMSGSGPAILGIFDTYDDAMVCVRGLNEKGIFAAYCTTSDKGIEVESKED